MKHIAKYRSIKSQVDGNWSQLTWEKKCSLLKELKDLRIIRPSFYYILITITILLFCFTVYALNFIFNKYKIELKDLSNLSILGLLALFSLFGMLLVFLCISLYKAKSFEEHHGESFRALKNKLINNIDEEKEEFYQTLDFISPVLLENIFKSLTEENKLLKDMSSVFIKDMKYFINQYRFQDEFHTPVIIKDESNASVRYNNV